MKPNVYIYILVMAGVTYLIRMLPLALAKKEITNPFIKADYKPLSALVSVLCALCLSGSYDVSGDFVGNGKCNFSCSGICSGADCSVQREESADCGASCLWCSIYCRKNNGLCGVSITKCLQSARAFLLSHSPRNPRSISPSNTVVAGPVI